MTTFAGFKMNKHVFILIQSPEESPANTALFTQRIPQCAFTVKYPRHVHYFLILGLYF